MLYVSYFSGNKELNLEPDLECKEIWLKLGVRPNNILSFGLKENFWEMGPTGPCGPCTEIYLDCSKNSGNQLMKSSKDFNNLIELWNIVFIQFQRYLCILHRLANVA